jgi:hypothetical protein
MEPSSGLDLELIAMANEMESRMCSIPDILAKLRHVRHRNLAVCNTHMHSSYFLISTRDAKL